MLKEIFNFYTDPLSFSSWNVIWVDDNGVSHKEWFYWKHHARDFYNELPYLQKKMTRSSRTM